MSESNREHLSCLMDGELEPRGARFLIRRLGGDEALKSTWGRYHVVRACIRKSGPLRADLCQRVAAVLAEEAAPAGTAPRHRWFKPVAGGAIAATVAVVAIVAMMPQQTVQQPELAQPAAQVQEPGFVSQSTLLDRPFTQQAMPVGLSSGTDRTRINTYVLRHNQMAGSSGAGGFVSYVPIVSAHLEEGAPPPEPAEEPTEAHSSRR